MKIKEFCKKLISKKFSYFATVPCNLTSDLHKYLENQKSIELFTTYHEHNLPGIAVGYYLAKGKPAVIHMQNSGFSNAYDGILTAIKLYKIPVLILVTWRGDNSEDNSEPHKLTGEITEKITESLGIPVFGNRNGSDFFQEMERAMDSAIKGSPSILMISSGVLEPEKELVNPERKNISTEKEKEFFYYSALDRDKALQSIVEYFDAENTIFIYSNGYTSRAAYALYHDRKNFFNIGYMGGTLAIGYTLATLKPKLDIVVVDGDQNSQMSCFKDHLFAKYPTNLHYFILDNHVGASVGGVTSIALAKYYGKIASIVDISKDKNKFLYKRIMLDKELMDAFSKLVFQISEK